MITGSFPCGKWLHKIGSRASPRCELCRREREMRGASLDSRPTETVAHIQSAGCNLQKKSVIGAHNRCWKYLIGAISTHGEAKRSLEVLGGDKDRHLHTIWKETKIGEILLWDDIEEEAEKLIASRREERRASDSNQDLPFQATPHCFPEFSSESVQSLEYFCYRAPQTSVPICCTLPLCKIGA